MGGSISDVAIVPKMASEAAGVRATGRMSQEATKAVCATCGRIAEDESVARLTWARGLEEGRENWTCDLCCREHLRSIEGKLDYTWW